MAMKGMRVTYKKRSDDTQGAFGSVNTVMCADSCQLHLVWCSGPQAFCFCGEANRRACMCWTATMVVAFILQSITQTSETALVAYTEEQRCCILVFRHGLSFHLLADGMKRDCY